MARRLWGCYSVADHLEPRAFVADLLLYDRLVVPVPAPDDVPRWEEQHWDPKRQARLLDILGSFAERAEWDAALREQFRDEWKAHLRDQFQWSPAGAVQEIGGVAGFIATRQDPYQLTRVMIGRQLLEKVIGEPDVRAVAVYAGPDSFNREWKLTKTMPFVRRATSLEPGKLREAVGVTSAEQQAPNKTPAQSYNRVSEPTT